MESLGDPEAEVAVATSLAAYSTTEITQEIGSLFVRVMEVKVRRIADRMATRLDLLEGTVTGTVVVTEDTAAAGHPVPAGRAVVTEFQDPLPTAMNSGQWNRVIRKETFPRYRIFRPKRRWL